MTLRSKDILRAGVAAFALVIGFAARADEPVPALYDGANKTYNISSGSILRQGEGFLSGVVATIGASTPTIQGTGICSKAACPVIYNGTAAFARRTRLTIPSAKKETVAQKIENALGLPVTELVGHTLRRGDNGRSVLHLQEGLNKKGAALTIDSNYGQATEDAVRSFQGKNSISADGVAGPATLKALGIYRAEKG